MWSAGLTVPICWRFMTREEVAANTSVADLVAIVF
jgi:hypothetical protein